MTIHDADIAADLDGFTGEDDLWGEGAEEPIEAPADETAANVLMRRLRRANVEIARIDAIAKAETNRIKLWHADRTAGLRRRVASLEAVIKDWSRAQPRKTVPTPWGTVRRSAPRPHVEVIDERAFVEWAMCAERYELLSITPARGAIGNLLVGSTADPTDTGLDPTEVVAQHFTAVDVATGEVTEVPGVLRVQSITDNVTVTSS